MENVGDTEAAYSMVLMDRYAVIYPAPAVADSGKLEGRWSESGSAAASGLHGKAVVLDITGEQPRWLTGIEQGAEGVVRFRSDAGSRYLVVSPAEFLRPEVRRAPPSDLKSRHHRADYLLVGPAEFLPAAEPLLALRRSQGLEVKSVALEKVYSEFGFGETTPSAIREFLATAYHEWRPPSPRYVLLLGDATYDFKDHLGTGVKNQVPPLLVKTAYQWTVSDPAYAAVNGEDILPDLAIGRLPAEQVGEVRQLVAKIVADEMSGSLNESPAFLVADDPDDGGHFEADAEEIASGLLAGRRLDKIYLGRLGTEATRKAILEAFDGGASLVSYMGHGAIHLWATENILDTDAVDDLSPQPEQPLLLTMTCLNGYFHFPYFDSLSEKLLKAEGKGIIAAVTPSDLSDNRAAHQYHTALLGELYRGNHRRLGDAWMAAQAAYLETGIMPGLLRVYHLLGDPALTLRLHPSDH